MTWRLRLFVCLWSWLGGWGCCWAQPNQAPVEVRVPVPPQPVVGSDGYRHLAYELHVTNFYPSTGTLLLRQVVVLAAGQPTPLATFAGAEVNQLLAHPATAPTKGVVLEGGRRSVLFMWLTLPARQALPTALRHQLQFETAAGQLQLLDGVPTPLNLTAALTLAPPLRLGPWLVHEGPGNAHSHHWGSLVAVNGMVTIPQRYAIDFFGLNASGHAVAVPAAQLAASRAADWVGTGTEVLAVANGVVRDCRDGEPDHPPLATLAPPTDLTMRTLLGNFVVLEIAPGIFVHYAHLQAGSLTVKTGQRVHQGMVVGRVGQSGNANAPHLHLQVTTAPTFEESEGIPFVFTTFTHLGSVDIGKVLNQAEAVGAAKALGQPRTNQLPLDGEVLRFP